MRVLVTGGAGFIGSHLAAALIGAGHDVAVLDDMSTGRLENVPQGALFFPASILSCYAAIHQFGPEVVYHLAAQSNYRTAFAYPDFDARTNVLGTIHLLDVCKRVGGVRKIVYASTGGGVYGEPLELPITEMHPTRPLSPYGASKRAAEDYVAMSGIPYTILRLGNVYGPRQNPRGEAGVVSIFAGQLLSGKPVHVNGDGEQTRDFVYVGDVARAFMVAMHTGDGETLNIGTGIETSIGDILARVAWAAGMEHGFPVEHAPAVAGEPRRIALDCSRARSVLNWHAVTLLPDGIRVTVEWVRSEIAIQEPTL